LDRRQGFFWGALILLTSFAAAAGVPVETGDNFERILSGLHPDYPNFVGGIRQGETRFHPPTLYMGLVRPGGKDPTRLDDAPLLGRGVKNDIIVYADSREVGRSPGWPEGIALPSPPSATPRRIAITTKRLHGAITSPRRMRATTPP